MARTLREYTDISAQKDADLFRRLVANSANGHMALTTLMQHLTAPHAEQKVRTHVITRAARMGWCMAGEAAVNMPNDIKEKYPDLPWSALRELRDLYTHTAEKVISKPDKFHARTGHLIARIAQTPDLRNKLETAIAQETGPAKLELQYIQRGLRYAMALSLLTQGQSEFVTITERDPRIREIANSMHCPAAYLPILIANGCGRMTLLETGDILNATSLFLESNNISRSIPSAMRNLRNKIAHFKDFRKTNDGHMEQADTHAYFSALDVLSGLSKALGSDYKHQGYVFNPAPIGKKYYSDLTQNLKPEAIAYLDTVVERLTAVTPPNTKLEQATIIAASNLLAEHSLAHATAVIDAVLEHRTSMTQRDATGALHPPPFALKHGIRELMSDIQMRCTRNHERALI